MCASRSVLKREVLAKTLPFKLPNMRTRETDTPNEGLEQQADASVLDARLRRLLDLIDANPLGTIQDWALAFNLSNSHLQRLFKQATGRGLGHALTEKRMLRAAHLLSHSNMSVKEVAHAVGYEHTSSFTRAFERHFEEAPRRYRRRNAA